MERTCPNCRASLDDDLADRTGSAECPFCGADVGELYRDESDTDSPTSDVDDPHAPPPGLLELIEWADDRLVVAIPPGGNAMQGMGCFAIAWLGITGAATVGFAGAGVQQGFDWELIIPYLVIGLFWLIGLGMLYAWLRSRNLTTYLLLERDRLAVQRILFGRKSTTVTTLGPDTRAKLATSFSQNDEPVYHVEVKGSDRTEKFGLRLDDDDKNWLVRAFNSFLHGDDPAASGDETATPTLRITDRPPSEGVEPLRPHELPSDTLIRVDDSYLDGLRFSLPTMVGLWSSGCGYGCGCLGSIWFLGCATFVYFALNANGGLVSVVVPTMMSLVGVTMMLVGTAFRMARTTVTVESEGVRMRWGVGPLAYTQFVPNDSITHVGLGTTVESSSGGKVTHSQLGAVLRADGKSYPLTINHGDAAARQVGGLVRAAVEDRGVRLQAVEPTDPE